MRVLSVNVAVPRKSPAKGLAVTGIDKLPVDHPIEVRPPGPKTTGLHSGVIGDVIGDVKNHGGDDQAVYAYAAEDYSWWGAELGRTFDSGFFGENLTTTGISLVDALIGEIWNVGDEVTLQATFGRIPCATFQDKVGERQWTKRFAQANRTGVYLRILASGKIRAGDPITVVSRPSNGVTVADAFRMYMFEPASLPKLLGVEGLSESLRNDVRRRLDQ